MKLCPRNGVVYFSVACWLGLAASASAGPVVNLMQPCDCPPNHYSAFEILTPSWYRWAAWCQGPCRYTFARVLHPDIPPPHYIKKYHCPSVNPLQFAIQTYPGLNGTLPQSTFQSTSEMAQVRRGATPQELPPGMQGKMKAPEQLQMPREEPEKK